MPIRYRKGRFHILRSFVYTSLVWLHFRPCEPPGNHSGVTCPIAAAQFRNTLLAESYRARASLHVGFFETDLGFERLSPSETITRILTNVAYKNRFEACEADAVPATYAGIDDSKRPFLAKRFGKPLGFNVAVWAKTILICRIFSDIVVLSAEIRKVVVVSQNFLHPADFTEFSGLVPSNFDLRSFKIEPGIPCATVRSIETITGRTGTQKGRIDDTRDGRTEH